MAYAPRPPENCRRQLPGVDASQTTPTYNLTSPLVSGRTENARRRRATRALHVEITLRAHVREASSGRKDIVLDSTEAATGKTRKAGRRKTRESNAPTPRSRALVAELAADPRDSRRTAG